MPQPYENATANSEISGLGLNSRSNACPNPLTPLPEQQNTQYRPVRSQNGHPLNMVNAPSPDNTAAGMAQSQEDSIYLSPASTPEAMYHLYGSDDKDKMEFIHDDCKDGTKTPLIISTVEALDDTEQGASNPATPVSSTTVSNSYSVPSTVQHCDHDMVRQDRSPMTQSLELYNQDFQPSQNTTGTAEVAHLKGLAPIDLLFNRSTTTQPWTFSKRRLLPDYPSHVFQPFSHYTGTQQSDRQTYNVDVTILTVDIAQCTMTGYLLIKGLTPEHDTLQTYFTGEIIGGPPKFAEEKQYYTFRTANPSWGATEKTDLIHWQRFPAWRSLYPHAKRDINFTYPTDGGSWWEQENIFMRWKEHFLVPDHKTKSIAGASFEGFYYICLNQVQGEISGIYYHSKSEKYQQLKLEHEGRPDVFNRGVAPCIEFR